MSTKPLRITRSQNRRGPVTRPAPTKVFNDLQRWAEQHRKYAHTGRREDRPDHTLLISGLPDESPIGLTRQPTIMDPESNPHIKVWFEKPKGEGETYRLYDVETFYVLRTHCLAAGRIYVEHHGQKGDYYYPRTAIPPRRRIYIHRLIVGSEPGQLTREGQRYRDQRRAALGKFFQYGTNPEAGSVHGREEAIAASCDNLRTKLAQSSGLILPDGLTPELLNEMLAEGYRFLDEVPLGRSGIVRRRVA